MEFKKVVTTLSLLAASTLVLTACGGGNDDSKKESSSVASSTTASSATSESSSSEETAKEKTAGADLQDGTYKLVEKNYDDKGWKVEFSMTVKDGKITESDFDYLNEDGNKKSEDEDYQKNMSEKSEAKIGPADFIPELNEALVDSQDAATVEVVSGATSSSTTFQNYAQQLVQAAQAGKTETIEIDNGAELKDGTYTLEEKNDSNNYHVVFNMTVEGGKITKSDYNYVNPDGKLKTDDEEYETKMKDVTGTGPAEYIPALNDELVEKQAVKDVEVVSGATHSSDAFKLYASQLVNAAEKGDTAKIEVDNFVYAK